MREPVSARHGEAVPALVPDYDALVMNALLRDLRGSLCHAYRAANDNAAAPVATTVPEQKAATP